MFRRLLVLLVILSLLPLLPTEITFAETDTCIQEPDNEISGETLADQLNIKSFKGKITGLPGVDTLKENEIEVDRNIYLADFDSMYLDISMPDFKQGDEVTVYYRENNGEKKLLMIQSKSEPDYIDAYILLRSLDVMSGYADNGTADLPGGLEVNGKVLRAQFIMYIVNLLGYNDEAFEAKGTSWFSDVTNHWGSGFINIGYTLGIVKGCGNRAFKPDNHVTCEEALTAIVRMLGYETAAIDKGGYPAGYVAVAGELGITDKVEAENGKFAELGSIAYMLFNSLPVKIIYQRGYKPVIYLYPEKEQNISVKLNLRGRFTFTYPPYNDGWNVKARPDGTIINSEDGREYSYLFWEGDIWPVGFDFSKGFSVKGQDTIKFLQGILAEIGLTPEESNEFIVYWAPRLQNNKYNLITFAGKEYEEAAPLAINPPPDSILRIFMAYKPLEEPVEVEAQEIKHFVRKGFTVVEWGGTEVK